MREPKNYLEQMMDLIQKNKIIRIKIHIFIKVFYHQKIHNQDKNKYQLDINRMKVQVNYIKSINQKHMNKNFKEKKRNNKGQSIKKKST